MLISILLTKGFWLKWCLKIIGDIITCLVAHSIVTLCKNIKHKHFANSTS